VGKTFSYCGRSPACVEIQPGSLRSFYRRRAAVLQFMMDAPVDVLRARVNPQLLEYIAAHTLVPEWRRFVAQLEELASRG
jgi:hypothetical protein